MDYVNKVFNTLHDTPELGWKEFKTSEFIANELNKMGIKYTDKISGTGIVAIIDSGKAGLNFGLRADMDALPYIIDGKDVAIHACGHDANSSIVLAVAKNIIKTGIKRGKLFLIFQPAEEVLGGAKSIIDSGNIDELEELVGIHLRPKAEGKLGEATPALLHASSYRMYVNIIGSTSHGARPHLGINAIDASMMVVSAINSIHMDPNISYSVKVTKLQAGGEAVNTIPEIAKMGIDIRAQRNETMDELLEKVKNAVINGAKSVGAEAEIELVDGVPGSNHDNNLIRKTEEAIIDSGYKSIGIQYTPGGEDFHFYSKKLNIKTAYLGIGCDMEYGLHHKDMNFNKKALGIGTDILTNLVYKKLGKAGENK